MHYTDIAIGCIAFAMLQIHTKIFTATEIQKRFLMHKQLAREILRKVKGMNCLLHPRSTAEMELCCGQFDVMA